MCVCDYKCFRMVNFLSFSFFSETKALFKNLIAEKILKRVNKLIKNTLLKDSHG